MRLSFKHLPLLFGILSIFITFGFYLLYLNNIFENRLFWVLLTGMNFITGLLLGSYIMLLQRSGALDVLTGLYNRHYLYKHLRYRMQREKNEGKTFCLTILDLDDFKKLNDLKGHLVGDQVLRSVSHIIKKNIRDTDLACRWGGEEFVIVLFNISLKEAQGVLERIKKDVSQALDVTFSAGLVCCDTYNFEEIEVLLEKADQALYEAKVHKDSIVAYDLVC